MAALAAALLSFALGQEGPASLPELSAIFMALSWHSALRLRESSPAGVMAAVAAASSDLPGEHVDGIGQDSHVPGGHVER